MVGPEANVTLSTGTISNKYSLNWEVCGEALNGREAVRKAKELEPDVVILDVSMPELNGVEATREIVRSCPKTEVLVLTVHDSDSLIREILDAGARGYILKSDAT